MNLRLSRSRMKILAVNLSKVKGSAVTPKFPVTPKIPLMNLRLSRSRHENFGRESFKGPRKCCDPRNHLTWAWHEGWKQQDLPVLAIEMSMHVQGHRLRRVRDCLANAAAAMWPSPSQDKIGTRKW